MQKGEGYDARIDLLRFLFALGIIGVHTDLVGFDVRLIGCGHLGVDFFFILSAYFTVKEALQNDIDCGLSLSKHVKKRVFHLLPFYFIAVVFSTMALIIINTGNWKDIIFASFFDFLPFQMMGYTSNVSTGVQWYIGVLIVAETILYVLVNRYKDSFVRVIGPLTGVIILGLVFISEGTLITPGNKLFQGIFYVGMFRGIADMFLGCFVYSLCQKLQEFQMKRYIALAIRIIVLIVMGTILFKNQSGTSDFVFVYLVIVYLSFLFSDQQNVWKRNYITIEFRNISLMLFMVHFGVGRLINYFFPYQSISIRLLELYGVSIMVAFILYHLAIAVKRILHKYILPHVLYC